MEANDIPVVKREQFETYKQTIRPRNQEEVDEIMTALHKTMRLDKFTGSVNITVSQGGIREIVAQQIGPKLMEDK
jgi:hypothetical protein